jgi:hypothetical protein
VDELRRRARQRIEVWFDDEPSAAELSALPGLDDVTLEGKRLTATLSGSIQPLLELLARNRVVSMLVEEPDLEDAFLDLYDQEAA